MLYQAPRLKKPKRAIIRTTIRIIHKRLIALIL